MLSIQKQIEKKISEMETGSIFSISYFTIYGKYDTVKKVLLRLEESKRIVRIIDGIYVIPKFSKLTKELIPPSISDVASHIADKYGWSIVPTGDTCLNYLGLSTQMPAHYEYISDGPYRKYEVLGFTINFKHTTNKEVKNLSYKSAVVVQAIKTIGKDNIDEKVLLKIRECLSNDEQRNLLSECRKVTSWVFECIKKIAEVRYDQVSE
jgi:hypothetical protein